VLRHPTGTAVREGHPAVRAESARTGPPPRRGGAVVVPHAVRGRGGADAVPLGP
jgi:hypothetical protein